MPPRNYRQEKRAERVEDTRRRLVEAAFALHAEQGVAATTMKQIAARAGVGVGTVYHHFPTYEDAVRACGEHTGKAIPPPGVEIFAGAGSLPVRVRRLVEALHDYYARLPALERLHQEQDAVPPLRAFVEQEQSHRLRLAREALRPAKAPAALVRAVAALLDVAVYGALRRAGFKPGDAIRELTALVLARVGGSSPPAP